MNCGHMLVSYLYSRWDVSTVASFPHQVIAPRHSEPPELELYPIGVRLLRHHLPQQPRPIQGATTFTDMMGSIGGMVMRESDLY